MKIKTEKQYNRIIEGATAILLAEGLAGFSTLKVSRLIEMSQSNIYVYFKNKEDLLVSTFTYHQQKYVTELTKAWQPTLPPRELLRSLIQAVYQFSQDFKDSLAIIWMVRQSTELRSKIPQVEDDQIFKDLFNLLADYQKQNIIRDYPLLYTTNVIFAAIINYIQLLDSNELSNQEMPLDDLVTFVADFLFV